MTNKKHLLLSILDTGAVGGAGLIMYFVLYQPTKILPYLMDAEAIPLLQEFMFFNYSFIAIGFIFLLVMVFFWLLSVTYKSKSFSTYGGFNMLFVVLALCLGAYIYSHKGLPVQEKDDFLYHVATNIDQDQDELLNLREKFFKEYRKNTKHIPYFFLNWSDKDQERYNKIAYHLLKDKKASYLDRTILYKVEKELVHKQIKNFYINKQTNKQ